MTLLLLQNTSILLQTRLQWYSSLTCLLLWLLIFIYLSRQLYLNDYCWNKLCPPVTWTLEEPWTLTVLKPRDWKGSSKSWHPHPYSLAHGLRWSALRSHGMRERPSVKALEKTTPHLLLPKLEDTNSEAALGYISHHIPFSMPQTFPQTQQRSRFSPWMGKLQLLSLGWHRQLLESNWPTSFWGSRVLPNASAPQQTQSCSGGNTLTHSVMCACISPQNKDTCTGRIPLSHFSVALENQRIAPHSCNRNASHRL